MAAQHHSTQNGLLSGWAFEKNQMVERTEQSPLKSLMYIERTPRLRVGSERKNDTGFCGKNGWGGWIRTNAWRYQKPLPYRLATPQTFKKDLHKLAESWQTITKRLGKGKHQKGPNLWTNFHNRSMELSCIIQNNLSSAS